MTSAKALNNQTKFELILDHAHRAASAAQVGMVENVGALDCGFAWVTISGTDPLARYCRKTIQTTTTGTARLGGKGYPTGWQFWKPGNYAGQSIGIHEAGARAFRDKLAEFGIRADVGSRLD